MINNASRNILIKVMFYMKKKSSVSASKNK